jgi:hypothetical protein
LNVAASRRINGMIQNHKVRLRAGLGDNSLFGNGHEG